MHFTKVAVLGYIFQILSIAKHHLIQTHHGENFRKVKVLEPIHFLAKFTASRFTYRI